MSKPKSLSRRDFINKTSGALLALSTIPILGANSKSEPERMGKFLGASPAAAKKFGPKRYHIENNLFLAYDLDRKTHSELEIPIGLSHDTVLHPHKPHALIVELDGPYACLVDHVEMKVLGRIQADAGCYFTGHAIYSKDGRNLYIGQFPRDRNDLGHILQLNGESLQPIRRFNSGGIFPHSFAWMPDETSLAIGHYGLAGYFERADVHSVVSIYDTVKEQVSRVIRSPEPNLYLCHLQPSKSGRIFVFSHDGLKKRGKEFDRIRKLRLDYDKFVKVRPGDIDYELFTSPLLVVEPNEDKFRIIRKGENYKWSLSIAMNAKHNVVAATHAMGKTLSFQDLHSGKFIKEFSFAEEHPRAIVNSSDQNYFIVSTSTGKLHFFNSKTLEIERTDKPSDQQYAAIPHARCV